MDKSRSKPAPILLLSVKFTNVWQINLDKFLPASVSSCKLAGKLFIIFSKLA